MAIRVEMMPMPALDHNQSKVHTHCAPGHYLSQKENVERLIHWITFYRRNFNRFASHYLGLGLHLYQHIILYLMGLYPSFCIIAARSAAKSFVIAIYACCKAILYPGSKIVIASGTKRQSKLIVSEKIKTELCSMSPNLNREIRDIRDNQNDTVVYFRNGSTITVVPASDNARGYRSTVLIYEEFRTIDKNVVDSVLSPFSMVRQPPYIKMDEYTKYFEEPTEIYISSAWLRSHWMWGTAMTIAKDMYNGTSCLLAMDYSVTLRHNIKTRRYMADQKKKLDPISWAIEYENEMLSSNTKAYFTFDIINKNQVLKRAFYPVRNSEYKSRLKNKNAIPRQDGEIRILSCDIAMINNSANDNSVYTCIRMLPEGVNTDGETRGAYDHSFKVQVPYLEASRGYETTKQAIRIKQLYEDFDADFCVLDTRNAGISVGDALMRVLYDDERDVEYKPWTYMNDDELAKRISNPNALPVIYSFTGTARINSEIAINLRNMLAEQMIDLLISNTESSEEIQKRFPEYLTTTDTDLQLYYERPYLETMCLVNEMVNLEYEKMENTGLIKIKELPTQTKDRYISLAMGCFFASEVARDLFSRNEEADFENFKHTSSEIDFELEGW
jgi:hypothetical protein